METEFLWLSALLVLLGPALPAAATLTAADRLLADAAGLLPRSPWVSLGLGLVWWAGTLVTGVPCLTLLLGAFSIFQEASGGAAATVLLSVALPAVATLVPIGWAASLLVRAGSTLSRRQFAVASVVTGLVSLGGALVPLTAGVMLADSAGFFYIP